MNRRAAAILLVPVLIAGCRSATVRDEGGPTPARVGAPETAAAIPVGLDFNVRLNESLSTRDSNVGDRFTATVTETVLARNGETLIPQGATVHGTITDLDPSDHAGDVAYIRLNFDEIQIGSRRHPFNATIVDTNVETARNGETRRIGQRAGAGAAAGAVLGAIIGRDLEDAILGAAVGAGIGTAISLGTGEVQAVLPAGTHMTLRATQRVQLR